MISNNCVKNKIQYYIQKIKKLCIICWKTYYTPTCSYIAYPVRRYYNNTIHLYLIQNPLLKIPTTNHQLNPHATEERR